MSKPPVSAPSSLTQECSMELELDSGSSFLSYQLNMLLIES